MARYENACLAARRLFSSCYDGVLATNSVDMPGYPFGSVLPFCCDRQGYPLLLVADIAQHTRNMQRDPHVSLIVFDRTCDDLQTHGRLTLMGDVRPLADDCEHDAATRYFRMFPEAREFRATHNFAFWRLAPARIRYIGGFGDIHWLEPVDLMEPNPFSELEERRIVEHMNRDHLAAMCVYLGLEDSEQAPTMTGIDARGVHLRLGGRVLRCDFGTRISNVTEAREMLARMAHNTAASAA